MSETRARIDFASSAAGLIAQFQLAASFLTILPVRAPHSDNSVVAASFRWFPLVGFFIGATLALEDWLLHFLFPPAVAVVMVILSLTAITGAVHLDALADTFDALGAGRDRQRALDILHDSRVGTFGAAAIFFSLALKTIALGSISGGARYAALIVATGLARWSMVAVAYGLEYLRSEGGAGASLLQRDPDGFTIASSSVAMVLLLLFSPHAIVAALVALMLTGTARRLYRQWLGGVTGDLIGACGEVVEAAVLLTFAAR